MRPSARPLARSAREAFREMRFALRHEAGMIDHAIGAIGGDLRARAGAATVDLPRVHQALGTIPTPPAPILRLADAVFGRLEKAAVRALAPPHDDRPFSSLGPVTRMIRREGAVRELDEAAFIERHYRLARDVLGTLGATNLLLSEQAIGSAARLLSARHGDLVRGISFQGTEKITAAERAQRIAFCAAMALVLERARPIRGLDLAPRRAQAQHLLLGPNLYVFVLIAIATAVVSTNDSTDTAEAIEAAGTVVDVRFSRFSAALQNRDPLPALIREFAAVVPHLP